MTSEARPTRQGFDQSLGVGLIGMYLPPYHPDSVNCYLGDKLDNYIWNNVKYAVRHNLHPPMTPNQYFTDYLADEASQAIIANQHHPFFMYLSFTAVHSPLQALRSDYDLFNNTNYTHCEKVYAAMILSLDRSVGKVLDTLEQLQLTNNTMVIFTSDNGAPGYINQRYANYP